MAHVPFPNLLWAPLAGLYGGIVRLRNWLFDRHLLPEERFDVPLICVGNLAVGGTGKTPHTEYLVRLLLPLHRVAVLSRGYKRKSKGFLLATDRSTCEALGDEPFQMKRKFPGLLVAVDADRRRGIRQLLALPPERRPEVILLDDALQHRYVKPGLTLLLTDWHRPYFLDALLPAGRLREPASGARRADLVLVTKCPPQLTPVDSAPMEARLQLVPRQQAFFTQVCYAPLQPLFPQEVPPAPAPAAEEILVIAGIAAPAPFLQEAERHARHTVPCLFPDHHAFSRGDLLRLDRRFAQITAPDKWILTTEKDAMRLLCHPDLPAGWRAKIYYLPITIRFLAEERQQQFDRIILNYIKHEQQD